MNLHLLIGLHLLLFLRLNLNLTKKPLQNGKKVSFYRSARSDLCNLNTMHGLFRPRKLSSKRKPQAESVRLHLNSLSQTIHALIDNPQAWQLTTAYPENQKLFKCLSQVETCPTKTQGGIRNSRCGGHSLSSLVTNFWFYEK